MRPHRVGFTLIELLVVIAIISLLVTILIPSLQGVQEYAKTTKCMTNLRTIGTGLSYYTTENKSYLPMGKYMNSKGEEEQLPTFLVSGGYVEAPTYDIGEIGDTIPSAGNVFRCPAGQLKDAVDGDNIKTRQYATGGKVYRSETGEKDYEVLSWYAGNGRRRDERFPFPANYVAQADDPFAQRVSDIKSPGKCAGMFDGYWLHNGAWERIAAPHNGLTRTCVMMVDGTVSSYDMDVLPIGELTDDSTFDDPALEAGPGWRVTDF